MKRFLLLFILVAFFYGCIHAPIQGTTSSSAESAAPQAVVERFRLSIPEIFQLLNTVVFEYNGQKFLGLGTLEIDTNKHLFRVACLNPMGVKLFELSGDERTVTTQYAIGALLQYGDIAAAVSTDIRRIYFNLLPSSEASVWKRKYRFHYRQIWDAGFIEYIFSRQQGDLVEKRYYDENHIIAWQISYNGYRDFRGKRFPQDIILVNYQHGYTLTVHHKELN